MKKGGLLVFLLVVFVSVVYAKDCVVCNGNQVVAYYGCPALSTCGGCVNNNKFSSSATLETCDTASCFKCHDPVGADASCKLDCSSSQVCSSGTCCKPDGATCLTDGSCCSGDCKGLKCVVPCTPDCAGKCGGASDGCGGSCNAACPSGQTCENKVCAACSGCISGGSCYPGTTNNMCGSGGAACQTCSGGKACSNGVCTPPISSATCGDSVIDSGEDCDGTNLNGKTCTTVGSFTGGILRCGSNCKFDTSGCTTSSCKSNAAACSSHTECCSGYCSGTCKSLSGGTAAYAITNKKSVYKVGDTITSTWSLPSYAYEDVPCTVHFMVNGGVGEDFYVYCGDPGLDANGDTGTLSTAHCYGKTTVTTNTVQIVIKDSQGTTITQSGPDSYTIDCSSSSSACKNEGEICTTSNECCSGFKCYQTFLGYNRVYKCLPASTGCNTYNFVSGSTQPTTGEIGDKFTIRCDYGAKVDCIFPWSPSSQGSCEWKGFEGTTAVFDCTAKYPGGYTNYCRLFTGTNDRCCESYDAAGSIDLGPGYRCTCQPNCGWETCTQADVGKTTCKVGWTYMGPHYNEVRQCVYSEDDGCYLYLPIEDCRQKANAGCALNTATGKHECRCSDPCTPNEKKCVPTVKFVSPAPPGDWVIKQCNADGCGWKELVYCGRDETCDESTKTCVEMPCPYCCPSGMTCSSPSGGVGCTSGTCCSSQSACTSCTNDCAAGSKQCSGTTGYQVCGNYDADSCLEWSSVFSCPSGQTCSNGVCSATCQNQCTAGSKQCSGSTAYQNCVLSGSCYAWGSPVSCPSGQTCTNGICSTGATCPNGVCTAGENCPADASSCADNKCYEPTCTNGCGQTAVASGQTDEVCYGNVGCGSFIVTGNPFHKGSISNNTGGINYDYIYSLFVSGNYVYLANFPYSMLVIVDVSNPSNPVHKSNLTLPRAPWGVFVSGNYAYIASYTSIQVVDVSNPAAPVFKGKIEDNANTLLLWPTSIFVSGNYVYTVGENEPGLQIVDVSNPSNPVHKGKLANDSINFLSNTNAVFVSGNYAYITSRTQGLEIVDVSNPASPVHKGKLPLNYPNGVFVSGNYAYVIEGLSPMGVAVVDVSNPANPVKVGAIYDSPSLSLSSPSAIYVSGDYAFVASNNEGVQVLNISNPTQPTAVGRIVDDATTLLMHVFYNGALSVSGKYVYVGSGYVDRGLEILELPGTSSGGNCVCNGAGSCVSGIGVTATCTDSDGADYFTKGNLTYTNNPYGVLMEHDACTTSSILGERVCKSQTEYTQNYESYACPHGCSDGRCLTSSCTPQCAGKVCGDDGCGGSCGTCPSGKTCSNGQCVSQPSTVLCNDYDNSPDYSQSGNLIYPITPTGNPELFVDSYATGIYMNSSTHYIFGQEPNPLTPKPTTNPYSTYYDHCANANQLNEAYCKSDGSLSAHGIPCPAGCQNGKCLTAAGGTACVDLDGKNYNLKGSTTGRTACVVQSQCPLATTSTDSCLNSTLLLEYICENDFKYVDFHHCDTGCQDGACVVSSQYATAELSSTVSVEEFKSGLIGGISDYLSDNPTVTIDEIKDMLAVYFAASGDSVNLDTVGQNSGENVKDIYYKTQQ